MNGMKIGIILMDIKLTKVFENFFKKLFKWLFYYPVSEDIDKIVEFYKNENQRYLQTYFSLSPTRKQAETYYQNCNGIFDKMNSEQKDDFKKKIARCRWGSKKH